MRTLVKKFLIGASIAAGVSAIASSPASAGSLTNASISGGQYIKYDANSENTFANPNASLSTILTGNSSSPTGNVELFSDSESNFYKNLNNFKTAPVTTLSGTIGGKSLSLSSLTGADWFTTKDDLTYTTSFGADNLANRWFKDFSIKAGVGYNLFSYRLFFNNGGFQKSSDPNISYVNQDDSTGLISIGLAGHDNVKQAYASLLGPLANFIKDGFQASEVVKYTYNGVTDFLYSFQATNSGLVEKGDYISHSGNYEVSFQGVKPVKSTPEPSVMLGMLVVGGVFATQRKLKKA
ncbi:PEP-CTERM sorting domain-containing protein [Scytonema sp. UIC 10036]|uniref:NF038130 family PEP-CTERM protein n=1 Tax=Scytonema sp. UIC 10036 TaxID=2304196 RepID=UPI0012DA08CB|nr:NF038130 family PEP-CTERM protein [Scytonema sp. UIC 10036]MUH00176.1 PEP-CTERM sorting domain-containing protein [Scytonema sp. UIC 10036]